MGTDLEGRLARAAWSRIVEPGDQVAGALLAAVGAAPGLRWLSAVGNAPDDIRSAVGRLCDRIGSEDAVTRTRLERAVARWAPRVAAVDPAADMALLARLGGSLVLPEDPQWPARLRDLGPSSPVCLWVRGDVELEPMFSVAVALVGARASSSYGERVAADLSAGLVGHGCTTVSGGAYGIDASVHRSTVAVGGRTVAFLAGGVDRLYPAGNADLLRAVISRGGLVVSEVPPGSVPTRARFLTRNRLIAAVSAVTVVVEAAWRSGSLATAARAGDLNRPVGAVPGPVTSPSSAGCHRLLREGRAVCVTDADEVWELAGPIGQADACLADVQRSRDEAVRRPHDGLDASTLAVFEALVPRRPALVDSIVRLAGVSVAEGLAGLGQLELRGLATRTSAGWVRAPL